ncbi:hydroxyacylglutathione hydrolase [Aestuariivirga litoralis]|uniref:hydroxyacylglutathione hydrolase n=1 Tax=Aestuariivirga litoralis TaxID=2650924 RepID=UPI0018C7A242|nr:hydroxyacylglutathione hydrolase [Aestuariivirga litoralis]MBG1233713.1 hydroxyacylglutathione hydrolase [Aestuariivirga litoralis]
MASLDIIQFPCRSDNFGVIIRDQATRQVAAIDAPEFEAVDAALKKAGWKLNTLFITHHHADHVEGNLKLKESYNCEIIGPEKEKATIPGIDKTLRGGESITWAGHKIDVLDCPGHTLGHISFHFPDDKVLFAADTLFSVGCGRVIEGTMEQMFYSVTQFLKLPPETQLYCGHEYTVANCVFALTVDAGNAALQARLKQADAAVKAGGASLPITLGEEFKTNPYLRLKDRAIRQHLGMENATDQEVFTEIRTRKNNFKG